MLASLSTPIAVPGGVIGWDESLHIREVAFDGMALSAVAGWASARSRTVFWNSRKRVAHEAKERVIPLLLAGAHRVASCSGGKREREV